MNCGVYTITSPSGKQYVGSAIVFYKRWSAHRRALEMGRHENKRLMYGGLEEGQ